MKRIGIVLKIRINELARHFYSLMGYKVEDGYDFSKAKHPTEKLVWEMAKSSFEYWKKQNEPAE